MTTQQAASHRLAGYGELVRQNSDFRWLWFGQIISLLGDWFNLIASASLIATLTESGLAVGGLFVVRMLAPFLISPVAGVVADRYNRKHVLILADLGRGIVVLGFLLVRDPAHVWLLYTLTACQLGISGFFFPARNAILPDLVSRRELGTANALSATTWSVMLAFGAALGGLVSGEWGTYPAFVIDALTFFASAAFLAQIQYRFESTAGAPADRTLAAALHQYADGLRYLNEHRDILLIASQKAALAVFVAGPFDVMQVSLTEKVFVIGENGGTSLGLMYAAIGVGTGIGPILARTFTGDEDHPQRIAIGLAYGCAALGLGIIAPLASFGVVLAGTALRGVGVGIIWVFSTQLLLQYLPDHVRGRVFATEFALYTLFYSIGAASSGWAFEHGALSISSLVWIMAGMILLPGAFWLRQAYRLHNRR
jgi:MFS family permease